MTECEFEALVESVWSKYSLNGETLSPEVVEKALAEVRAAVEAAGMVMKQ
jgi:hypothetical protein